MDNFLKSLSKEKDLITNTRKSTYGFCLTKFVFCTRFNGSLKKKALECLCTSPISRATDNDSETALRLNRSKYSKNIIFSYLNINFIRNKFVSVRAALVDYVDIFIVAETKINESFPTAQFAIDSFHKPLRLDVTDKSGGLLVYVRSYLTYFK